MAPMKKSPVPIAAIRDAVRRKSVALSFTKSNFSIFNRGASGSGADEDTENSSGVGEPGEPGSGGDNGGDVDFHDDAELHQQYRDREDSAPRENDESPSAGMIRNARTSYVEPPEPPLPPPGGLLEAATTNVQGKMREMMETFHEVTTSHVSICPYDANESVDSVRVCMCLISTIHVRETHI